MWWEKRRIPFNLIVGVYGLFCLTIFMVSIITSGHLGPGEDAVEPLALLAAPFGINVLYTLGWLVEVPLRLVMREHGSSVGPTLMKLGLGLGFILTSLPALLWGGYRVLQLVGIVS